MDQTTENSTTSAPTSTDKQSESATDSATKPELSPEKRNELIKAAGLGMPWRLIAALIMVSLEELEGIRRDDPDLAKSVREAEAKCMKKMLEKLSDAEQWQASTFVLQSRWPGQFGRNRKPRIRKKVEPSPTKEMFGRLKPHEFEMWSYLTNKMNDDTSGKPGSDSDKRGKDGAAPASVRPTGVADPGTDAVHP